MEGSEPAKSLDLRNTEIAFSHLSDKELKNIAKLFSLMSNSTLVNVGSKLGLIGIKMHLPFTESIIRNTIFKHFCGGESLLDCQKTIDKLYKYDTLTILDYGAEAKSDEEDLDRVMQETVRAVELAASNDSVPVVSTKLTGMADNDLLEKIQSGQKLETSEKLAYDRLYQRVDTICSRAHELGVGIYIDAEESWLQDTIDHLVNQMMEKYNKAKAVVSNTFQLYRHDRLQYLKDSYQYAQEKSFYLGAKLVRGAYMEKERDRASENKYKDPIQPNKKATDDDYHAAVRFCVERYDSMALCNATHNIESSFLQAKLIDEFNIPRNHPNLNFSQLLGMSDYITFNLADAGYNVAKYVPYGPVREVVPYLIRRAEENTAVQGSMSRELNMIRNEMKNRGL